MLVMLVLPRIKLTMIYLLLPLSTETLQLMVHYLISLVNASPDVLVPESHIPVQYTQTALTLAVLLPKLMFSKHRQASINPEYQYPFVTNFEP